MNQEALEILERHQIKPSYQRVTILEYLLEDRTHPTADQIYKAIVHQFPVISKATVYNTLSLFSEKGIVSTMIAARNELRYDLVTESHGHFVCETCGRIYNVPYTYRNVYDGLEGFEISAEEIVLRGECRDCISEKNKK